MNSLVPSSHLRRPLCQSGVPRKLWTQGENTTRFLGFPSLHPQPRPAPRVLHGGPPNTHTPRPLDRTPVSYAPCVTPELTLRGSVLFLRGENLLLRAQSQVYGTGGPSTPWAPGRNPASPLPQELYRKDPESPPPHGLRGGSQCPPLQAGAPSPPAPLGRGLVFPHLWGPSDAVLGGLQRKERTALRKLCCRLN